MTNETEEKRNRSMDSCNKCGFCVGGMVHYTHKLCGIYEAVLCLDCLSSWNLFCNENETCKEMKANSDEFNTIFCQIQADGIRRDVELNKCRERETKLNDLIFLVAESWVNDHIERESPEEIPPPTPEEMLEQDRKILARYERRVEILRQSVSAKTGRA